MTRVTGRLFRILLGDGTWIKGRTSAWERAIISRVAHDAPEAKDVIQNVPDTPGSRAHLQAIAERA